MTGKFSIATLLALVLLTSCSENNGRQIGSCYERLVMNEVMTSTRFKCHDCFSKDSEKFSRLRSKIFNDRKIVSDKLLKIDLILHRIDTGEYPNLVVYVSDPSGFEYAFSFNDEAYYLERPFMVKDDQIRYRLMRNANIESQFNIIANQLNINNLSDKEKLDRFITLFFDSMLGMTEIRKENFTQFTSNLRKSIDIDAMDSCRISFDGNMQAMQAGIESDTSRYFHCYSGGGGFWKLATEQHSDSKLFIRISFENYQCYSGYYL